MKKGNGTQVYIRTIDGKTVKPRTLLCEKEGGSLEKGSDGYYCRIGKRYFPIRKYFAGYAGDPTSWFYEVDYSTYRIKI